MRSYRYIFLVLFICFSQQALAQVYLGPGFGTNRNKKMVESDTRRYQLLPSYQDYKVGLGIFVQPHFYLDASFNVYRQEIRSSTVPANYPTEGIPQTGFVASSYSYVYDYRYHGFTVVPNFVLGQKLKFFVGAGINLDYSRINSSRVLVSEDHYHYDSLGHAVFDYNTSYDTTNLLVQRKGSDFSGLVQTGMIISLGRSLILQLSAYYRRSFVLRSLEAEGDYKSNAGLSVSILYRLWPPAAAQKEPGPVE